MKKYANLYILYIQFYMKNMGREQEMSQGSFIKKIQCWYFILLDSERYSRNLTVWWLTKY